ncbi:putative small heat shock protein HSP20 [Rosa chinensis]|uniref:Putative small heat shock protein HSP20 n=1 Tax=Rosa chinensis TaxID=74649 RepID=A0A2P6RW60_ROSCH|nr:26.5 kDa heat shock protein, mitochondrial isoform X2 [Rosa chinensis]PRQ50663.1 putative small heat shock protein HSP20 [Rosa chinensis]
MALARLALKKHFHQRVLSPSSSLSAANSVLLGRGGSERRLLATDAGDKVTREKTTDDKDLSISEAKGRWTNLFPNWSRSRGLWSNRDRDFVPALSGLERALLQATGNISRLFENLNISPWSVSGRVKEQDDCYKLRFDMPGLNKEDVKISVHHGVLTIKGEQKDEEGEETEDEFWSSRSYGYYHTSFALPDDAKVDEIKASLRDGVLSVTIPRTEKPAQDVKEVNVH